MKCALEREETKKECLEVLIVEGRENSASGIERFRVTRRTAKCFCDVWTPANIGTAAGSS